jgi:hypothetical protein
MRQEKPETKDWLSKDVQDSVRDDLAIDRKMATSVSDAPDAISC